MSTQSRIVHFKREPYDVYIGRPSKWGNLWTHKSEGSLAKYVVPTRDEAVRRHRIWLSWKLTTDLEFRKEFMKLKGKTLGCWCVPQKCHGHTMVEFLDNGWIPILTKPDFL